MVVRFHTAGEDVDIAGEVGPHFIVVVPGFDGLIGLMVVVGQEWNKIGEGALVENDIGMNIATALFGDPPGGNGDAARRGLNVDVKVVEIGKTVRMHAAPVGVSKPIVGKFAFTDIAAQAKGGREIT